MHDNLVRVLGDKRFFYDGHGRLIRKLAGQHTDQHFVWDDENRLTEVITTRRPGTAHAITQTTRFDYDALGRRVAKHDAFGATTFIWEGMRLIEERRGSSVISYVYEPGSYVPLARLDALGEHTAKGGLGTAQDNNPSASISKEAANDASIRPARSDAEARYWASLEQTASEALDRTIEEHWAGNLPEPEPQLAKVYYFHNSPVGLPEELTNAQGQIVWQANYKTWGNTVSEQWDWVNLDGSRVYEQDKGDIPDEEGRQQNLRFQGQYLDRDTGLHYNTFRYYDPDLGRFISPDPIGLIGGINFGSYAPNPIAWIDPWGWSSFDPYSIPGAEITPFPQNLHFGQTRAAPNFSTIGSQAHPDIVGRSISDVASDIRSGKISPDVMQISYTIDPKTNLPVTLNNRGLAALVEGGKFPSDAVRVPYDSVPPHLKSDWSSKPPSPSINITSNKDGSGFNRSVTNQGCRNA